MDTLGIVTLVSDSLKMPVRRGDNILIPHRDGRVFVAKKYEQRKMALGLEVSAASLSELETALDTVKALLGGRSLGTLQQTLEDLSVRTIQAEYVDDLNLSRISPLDARLLLEFIAPDPFFRLSVLFTDTHIINASPKTYTLTNPGTADERNPKIILTGPLNNVTITNMTNGKSVSYNGVIASPRVVTIMTNAATGEYVATDDLSANVIGNVTHVGDTALFALEAGANSISVTDATHTTGTVGVEFYPPYL